MGKVTVLLIRTDVLYPRLFIPSTTPLLGPIHLFLDFSKGCTMFAQFSESEVLNSVNCNTTGTLTQYKSSIND